MSEIRVTAYDARGARFVADLAASCREDRRRTEEWGRLLAGQGVALTHPDDGWVDRVRNTILLTYPTILTGGPAVGALVALGTSDRWRIVELTACVPAQLGSDRWAFREIRRQT